MLGLVGGAAAHSIDYLAAAISPPANFNGQSGNFTLTNSVAGGTVISFDLTFSINTQGSTTTYPITITFGVTDTGGPAVPLVYFGASGTNQTFGVTFQSSDTTATTQVRITAPSDDGNYTVKIGAITGTGGRDGLSGGGGINVSFTVTNPVGTCDHIKPGISLVLNPPCIVLHSTSPVTFTSTLKVGDTGLSGKTIYFQVDGNNVGSAVTDSNGVATLSNYNPSFLTLGNHTVRAEFLGDSCDYDGNVTTATLGVVYDFLGFQPPVLNVQPDGTGVPGLFSGKVIPVKVKIADAEGMPITDAKAFVFFKNTQGDISAAETGADSVSASDTGNQMRYDPDADQYIFNWDTSKIDNGSYNIRIGFDGEGECAEAHLATVILKKSSGKKK